MTDAKDTLVRLQATITKTAETIEERRQAFFATPDDVETIHRFRTNSRALRSFVAFIRPWQKTKQNVEIQLVLKEVVRYTSRLRELDVLEGQVRKNPASSPELIACCAREAATERAKVHAILASELVAPRFERVIFLSEHIAWKRHYEEDGIPKDVVRTRFDALVESVNADLAIVELGDAEQTHDVRKRAKRARYVAEHNSNVLGTDVADIFTEMNAHQDLLGEVCDARANIRLIDELLAQNLDAPVAQELAQLRAQNEGLLCDACEAFETQRVTQ